MSHLHLWRSQLQHPPQLVRRVCWVLLRRACCVLLLRRACCVVPLLRQLVQLLRCQHYLQWFHLVLSLGTRRTTGVWRYIGCCVAALPAVEER